jgi:carboxymethylenebutenolidase
MRGRQSRIAVVAMSIAALAAVISIATSCQVKSAQRSKANVMAQTQPDGYLVLPSSVRTPMGAVLVLHPWWGLNDTMKSACVKLADEGFIVFAPDLHHGKIATTIAEAEALGGALDANTERAKREILEAAAFLRERVGRTPHKQNGIAVIGFSMGAYYALDLSVTHPELVDSVVVFYGSRPSSSEEFRRSKAKVLGHFAETDQFEPQANVDDLEAALRSAGRPVSFHRYKGTGHWFFESDRPEYNQAAATLAWERTLEFLNRR